MSLASDDYLAAFMSGLEFVLLGMEGRLHDANLGDEERARVREFLADYKRVAEAYRARGGTTPGEPALIAMMRARN